MVNFPWKGAARPRSVSASAFRAAAARLGCEPAVLEAVWEVESSGRCFLDDGSVIRRFEPHHMPGATSSWRDSLKIGTAERERQLHDAYGRAPHAALAASSWGGAQIMGFNAAASGYSSAQAMVAAMAASADEHLTAFVRLLEAWGLATAFRAQDWLTIAKRWNGTGQPKVYAARMEKAYRRLAGKASPKVLRVGARGAAVTRLQEALGVAVDGRFGPRTLETVEDFQRAHGLTVDGIVGARTWAALERERAAAPEPQPTTPPLCAWFRHALAS